MSYSGYNLQYWQQTWDQPAASSRSGTTSAMQFDEVDRAIKNLASSGQLFSLPSQRDPMPRIAAPRSNLEYDPRLGSPAPRLHSIRGFDPMRLPSTSNLQNFHASQRFHPHHDEAEQMQQAQRHMAAQRERELRNYHHEQQYNRKMSTQGRYSKQSDIHGFIC